MRQSADDVFLEVNESHSISYGEGEQLSAQLANKLSEMGLQPGARVTAQVEKSYQVVILYLACFRAGLIFHPLNTAYTLNELEHFLADAQPSLLVSSSKRCSEAQTLIKQHAIQSVLTLEADGAGTLWEDIASYSDSFEVVHKAKDDTALLIYTSGTTGKPKGAMITHENLSSNAQSLIECWGWQKHDVLVHVLPLFHVHGLCVGLHLPILLGSKVIFQAKFSVERTIDCLAKATVMMAVPTIYTRLLSNARLNKEICRTMRVFISGSAPLLPETFAEFEARTGFRILERYGMSEAQMITSNPLKGERLAGTVGYPLLDIRVRICGDDGVLLGSGEIGSLEIAGPNVFAGYWRNPDATHSAFTNDGYFITGDLASVDENGVVTIVGRDKDLIISAGLNVYPREIELELNQLAGVADSAVFGVPHADLGEGVVAAVIRQSAAVNEVDLLKALKPNLSAFKVPGKIVFVEELPRNAMGKIEKNRLRETYCSVLSDT